MAVLNLGPEHVGEVRQHDGLEAPPSLRHGVELIYDDGEISIARRGEKFAVVHTKNARWIVTDERGASTLERLAKHTTGSEDDFPCSRSELIFIRAVMSSGFYQAARDAACDTPSVVCISVTERCNLSCSYCFYSASHEKNRDALHVTTAPTEEISRFLTELYRLNPRARVYLTGGEPFTNKDVHLYFRLIKEAGLYAGVVTNGVFLNHHNLETMNGIEVDEIRISVDGVSRDAHEATRPGTYDKVMAALERLAGYSFRVVLSMTVTKENQSEAILLARFASERGFTVSFSHMVPTGRGAEHLELLPDYEQLVRDFAVIEENEGISLLDRQDAQGWRRHTCGLAGQSLYVDLKGNSAPCNMLSKSGHELGNVFETSLSEVIDGKAARTVRAGVDEVRYCRNCHVRYICGGPCRASSYFAVGTLQSRGPDCAFKYAEVIDSIFRHGPWLPGSTIGV